MQIEWTFVTLPYVHDICSSVMPFPQTRPEVCRNFEYFVALSVL